MEAPLGEENSILTNLKKPRYYFKFNIALSLKGEKIMPGIRFKEDMDGYVGENIKDFRDGEDYGKRYKNTVKLRGDRG